MGQHDTSHTGTHGYTQHDTSHTDTRGPLGENGARHITELTRLPTGAGREVGPQASSLSEQQKEKLCKFLEGWPPGPQSSTGRIGGRGWGG